MANIPKPPFACGITGLDAVTRQQQAERQAQNSANAARGAQDLQIAVRKVTGVQPPPKATTPI